MTTQPETAVGSESAQEAPAATPETFFEELATELFPQEEEEIPADESGDEPQLDAEGETEGEEEADDLPPIEPPVSWDAEAKERFAKLPREDQEYLAKREGERERFVQTKSQEAVRAKQDAEQSAQQSLAQYDAQMAQQYQQLAAQFAPQAPDPSLLRFNPEAFYAQEAEYRTKTAQQQELQQQAQLLAQQAQARAAQIEQAQIAEQHRIIVENFPEYADPTTGPELRNKLTAAAKRIGYSDELIGQARAQDILALRTVSEALEKADKYDALQKGKMEKVRAAKGKPPVQTRPGVAQTPDAVRSRNTAELKATLLTSKNRDAQGAAFMELAKVNGWVS
jgi:hypothetical protein